jgi:hypothetical protein
MSFRYPADPPKIEEIIAVRARPGARRMGDACVA